MQASSKGRSGHPAWSSPTSECKCMAKACTTTCCHLGAFKEPCAARDPATPAPRCLLWQLGPCDASHASAVLAAVAGRWPAGKGRSAGDGHLCKRGCPCPCTEPTWKAKPPPQCVTPVPQLRSRPPWGQLADAAGVAGGCQGTWPGWRGGAQHAKESWIATQVHASLAERKGERKSVTGIYPDRTRACVTWGLR